MAEPADPGLRDIGTTAEERIALYQTWSNPVRRRILAHLAEHGPANSTALAKALGESTGTTSYHLRKLAEQHLIDEVGELANGRERWWRVSRISVRTPPRSQMTAEEREASEQLASMRASHDIELYLRFTAEYDAGGGWVDGDRFGTALTEDEVRSFVAEYRALVEKYSRSLYEAPPGARQMSVRFFIVPEDE
ncbi:MAG TPA: winged helix-turn-helix domain-containing protein [Actinospica sp.]|jgi:DNA-binding transcriptional ArsR family regulator|nr:winged helix-turn-helix domain-containing protein [Actinospica sp.]